VQKVLKNVAEVTLKRDIKKIAKKAAVAKKPVAPSPPPPKLIEPKI
jgi:hypothetical protein